MYSTIYIEKNKSTRFGIHFYKDSTQWPVFCENYGISTEHIAVIYTSNLKNEIWKTFAGSHTVSFEFSFDDKNSTQSLRDFLDQYSEYTFVVLSEPRLMENLHSVITGKDSKLSYILIPVTPFACFDAVSLKPKAESSGEISCKELFPIGIYVDTSILFHNTPEAYLSGIAAAFRLAVSYKASMFEWMISNLYELLDGEENAVMELLNRGYLVHKELIEKETAKDRTLPIYALSFYKILSETKLKISEADLWSLSMVCQSYLSWKADLLSMEEYYEIRDMFVAFGLAITETELNEDDLMEQMSLSDYNMLNEKETVLLRKLGKCKLHETPSKELIREAFSQIYYNEEAND